MYTWFLLILSSSLLALILWRLRQQRYLKRATRESIDPELRFQLEKESEDPKRRQAEFEKQLTKFQA